MGSKTLEELGGELEQIIDNLPLGVVDLQTVIGERRRYFNDLVDHHENIEDVEVLRDIANVVRDANNRLHELI